MLGGSHSIPREKLYDTVPEQDPEHSKQQRSSRGYGNNRPGAILKKKDSCY